MTAKARRIDFSPDEYITGVGGLLRADEQGVYWMICALVMSHGGPIDCNEKRIGALCQLRPSAARKIINALVDMGKIVLTSDGKLTQKRAESEVEKSVNRIQTAKENGSKGGRPAEKSQEKQQNSKAAGSFPEKLTTNYQLPTTNIVENQGSCPKPQKRRRTYPDDFEKFWQDYPTDPLMSKAEAFKVFSKLEPEDKDAALVSLPAFNAHCRSQPDYRPVHANRYLSQRRFEGFNKQSQATMARAFVRLDSPEWSAILKHRGVSSMPSKDFDNGRGWWFEKTEIQQAVRHMERAA